MRAMVLRAPGQPLELAELPDPEPGPGQVQIEVSACGVCRTDLHVVDGELGDPKLPLVLGHQIVGVVSKLGPETPSAVLGRRVGVPWLGGTCGRCGYCKRGDENLCDEARFTGYQLDGGYAELVVADVRYAFPLPDSYDDLQAAPLLCAGLIGYRALTMCGDAEQIGLYGFGAAAHIVAQLARFQGRTVGAFTRPGDEQAKDFARRLGAAWALDSDDRAPEPLDAAIVFAPVGALVVRALENLRKGGVVVCGGIHMSDIPSFPYELLWGERSVRSVANLTRADGEALLALAADARVRTEVRAYPFEQANSALSDLRGGRLEGAAVLKVTDRARRGQRGGNSC